MSDLAIDTRGLRKEFGAKVAVADLTLTVRQGEVFGFLGPNGAGKTTSVKMLLGLVAPTSGRADVLGRPLGVTRTRAKTGFLPEHFRFQDWLTGREFLRFHGRLFGMSAGLEARMNELLARVELVDAADLPLRTYSKGMLQRAGLAQALLNRPDLVFLDEPTSGLDPLGRLLVRDIINDLRAAGTAVFLNSHLLSEVEVTCDRVAFINHGRVLREMSLHEQADLIDVDVRLGAVTPELLAGLASFGADIRHPGGGVVSLALRREADLPALARWLVAQGADVYGLAPKRQSLESLFLEVMGEEGRPG